MTDGGRRGKVSAGLLMYRECGAPADGIEVFLVHPGGPFFRNRDEGAWTIPKGGIEAGEAARRRQRDSRRDGFTPAGPYLELTPVQHRAASGDVLGVPRRLDRHGQAEHVSMEWPRGSGRQREFPEIDYAAFFTPDDARKKLNPAQVAFVDELVGKLASRGAS